MGKWGSELAKNRALESHPSSFSYRLRDVGELRHFPRPRSLLWGMGIKVPPLLDWTTGKWFSALPSQAESPCMSHLHKPQGPDPVHPLRTRAQGFWILYRSSRSKTLPGVNSVRVSA